jgi:hypothetical protein
MIKRNFTLAALIAAGMFSLGTAAQAAVINLGSSGSGTLADGAIFQTNNDHPTGTGVYNPFLTIQNNGWEQGYNSSTGNFDTKREPQWNHEIKFSDLQVTTINGLQYFGFSVDINEPGGNKALISLDGLSIWTSSTLQNSTSTDGNGIFNGSLGTLRYDMGANQVLYNDQNTGSGGGDINIYIPVSYFANVGANDFVYMYQRWGNTDTTEGGFEETALIRGITPIPEMSALFPIVGLLVAVGSTHVLRRRRMARTVA